MFYDADACVPLRLLYFDHTDITTFYLKHPSLQLKWTVDSQLGTLLNIWWTHKYTLVSTNNTVQQQSIWSCRYWITKLIYSTTTTILINKIKNTKGLRLNSNATHRKRPLKYFHICNLYSVDSAGHGGLTLCKILAGQAKARKGRLDAECCVL